MCFRAREPGTQAWGGTLGGGIAWKGGELGALGSCFRAWQPGTQAWGGRLGGEQSLESEPTGCPGGLLQGIKA